MKIVLRTPDVIRRMTNRFDHIAPDWEHSKRLTALAAMFGYEEWGRLIASCDPQAPHFVFDQDLPTDRDRQQRWLTMAQQVAAVMDMPLPVALNLIQRVHPMSRLGDALSPWYEPNPVFDQALMQDGDIWWVGMSEVGNPLAPLGFIVARAFNVSELAKWRSQRRNASELSNEMSSIWVLLPLNHHGPIAHPHTYFSRGELVEIAPIPLADSVMAPKKHARYLASFFAEEYPHATEVACAAMLTNWRAARKKLYVGAGLAANSQRRGVQLTRKVREDLGESWHWPLDIRSSSLQALDAAEQQSIEIDEELKRHYGQDDITVVRVDG